MKLAAPLACLMVITLVTAAHAADNNPPPPPPPRGEMKGPPPFDPALCQNKAPGTVVETKMPDGRMLRGKCQLVFLPDPPTDRPAGSPPPAKP